MKHSLGAVTYGMNASIPEFHLTEADIRWMWAHTFTGYRWKELEEAYGALESIRRAALDNTIRPGREQEAVLRAQGDVWDLQRRQAYLERNRGSSGRDDFRVEYGGYHSDGV